MEPQWHTNIFSSLVPVGGGSHLTITIFPSLISLTNLVSLPSHFCTCTSLSPSMEKVDCKHKHSINGAISGQPPAIEQMSRWRLHPYFYSAYFDMPVIRCGLIKLLSQLGGELSVPEGAQGFHHHFVSILTYNDCWFGDIAHLSRGKTNTCQKKKKRNLKKIWAISDALCQTQIKTLFYFVLCT